MSLHLFYIPQTFIPSHIQATHTPLFPLQEHTSPKTSSDIHTTTMSSTSDLIKKIEAIIGEIKMLPPATTTSKQGQAKQMTPSPRPERPAPTLVPGWGNFFEDIKKNDEALYEEKRVKATDFAASGQERTTVTEVYSKGN